MFNFFFFFQAEDGIRDTSVTGVQTCALPILSGVDPDRLISHARIGAYRCRDGSDQSHPCQERDLHSTAFDDYFRNTSRVVRKEELRRMRSEERRVGKEGRVWGWAEHKNNNGI